MTRGAAKASAARALAPALLGLAALLALAAAASAGHTGEGVSCAPNWSCHFNVRPSEARSADTWVDETNPGTNYDHPNQNSEFLFVRASESQRAWTLLRFPLQDIPRNITVLDAEVRLSASTGDLTQGRTVRMWELRSAWNETTVAWNQAQFFNKGVAPIANVSIEGATQTTVSFCGDNPQGGGTPGSVCRADREGGVTRSFAKYLRAEEPYEGHVFQDEDDVLLELPQTQRFRSSSPLVPEAQRPQLVVSYDPNTPDIRDLLADGAMHINATSTRAVNLSMEVFDRLGAVTNAWINATDLEGREVFNRSVFQNRSTVFRNFDRHAVWTNTSLALPEGRYVINAFALDHDGNLNFTTYRNQANLTVENQPPVINQSRDANNVPRPFLSPTVLDEGATFVARLNATDGSPGNSSGIAFVKLELERAGQVLRNLTLNQTTRADFNGSGDYEVVVRADAAGFLNATLWVQDRAGNLNRTARIALHVRDILRPVILEARVAAPGSEEGSPVQEEGGVVSWEARVTDASPLTVQLELGTPAGPATVPMARQGLTDTYRYERTFTVRGSYAATLVARDEDQNTATRAGLGFFLREGTPPVISDPLPPPGAHGRGATLLSAVVQDLNLDPGSIAMEVRVGGSDFLPVEARTSTLTETSRRVEFEDTFFHGEAVDVRVRARDTLGRAAERTWSFTVDARVPSTFLTTEGPALAGNRTAITGNTTLRLDRQDQGSGVLATVVAVVNEDHAVGTGNLTITGTEPATLRLSSSPVYTGTGNYTLFFSTVDHAGNTEPTQERRFLLDDAAPRVEVSFQPGLLTARVREEGTGLREVRAFYWLAPGGDQGQTLMSPNTDRTVWQAQIPDVERGSQVLYAVEATDLLGNLGRAGSAANPLSSIVQNHAPTVTIAPGNGSLVRGAITIEWSAADRDGDAVETSVAVRPSTSTEALELAPRRGASGSVTWDTRTVGDGIWVVEVTARDSFEAVVARSLVDVTNTDSKVAGFAVQTGEPGQPTRFEATLYKPVQSAVAVVRLGGTEVARVPLRDDGGLPDRKERDGVFTGQFVPEQTGDYRVDLEVLFEDGRLEARPGLATASVQHGFPQRLWHDPVLLALVILVPLAIVAFVLYRRYGPPRFLRKWAR